MLRQRIATAFHGADPRVCAAFWLFGLINNVIYVIILSAALDLVGPTLPKAIVLLFDVVPSFFTKLLAPYFIHVISYRVRVLLMVSLSTIGMLLIATSPGYTDGATISTKMAGVMLASLSSGLGELSFLGLTHFYGQFSLAAWGSGTGAAGLVGAGAYALATTSLGLSVKSALLGSALLPLVMLASFFLILPSIPTQNTRYERLGSPPPGLHIGDQHEEEDSQDVETLLSQSKHDSESGFWARLRANLVRTKSLFIPYMLPLFLVYVSEYTINQGVTPTLLFDISKDGTPFTEYRTFYPTYNAIYQVGVFISRSTTPILRIHNLYLPSILQVVNLALLIVQSLTSFIPNVWFVFLIMFWEGLLGGAVYVNTFAEILEHVPERDREFSLGATSVSDSGGICIAGFLSLGLEPALCARQMNQGIDWCRRL